MLELKGGAKKILLIVSVVLLVTAATLTYSCYHHNTSSSFEAAVNASEIAPDEILGMNKMVVSTDVDALQRVTRSHTGSIEHVKDVAIVHYMKEGRMLTLWTTLYENETVAWDENEKMAIGMQNWGGTWSSHLEKRTIAEKQVYLTSPDGVSYQYFWADREWVFYIIPHNFTQDEIAEIIGAIPQART